MVSAYDGSWVTLQDSIFAAAQNLPDYVHTVVKMCLAHGCGISLYGSC